MSEFTFEFNQKKYSVDRNQFNEADKYIVLKETGQILINCPGGVKVLELHDLSGFELTDSGMIAAIATKVK